MNTQTIVANWESLDLNGPVKGSDEEEVRIIKYFDYGCLFCKKMNHEIEKLIKEHPDKISIKYVYYPIINNSSYNAALASYCSVRYGLFSEVHDYLYNKQDSIREGYMYDNILLNSDYENDDIYRCMSDDDAIIAIENNLESGGEIGIYSVPTVIVNGELFSGYFDKNQLIEMASSL